MCDMVISLDTFIYEFLYTKMELEIDRVDCEVYRTLNQQFSHFFLLPPNHNGYGQRLL